MSLVAKLRRTGILPLNLEVGRFKNMLEDERVCELCELNEVENESHFRLYCPLYDELRNPLFTEMSVKNPEMFWSCDDIKMDWLFNCNDFKLAKYVTEAWKKRQDNLYV